MIRFLIYSCSLLLLGAPLQAQNSFNNFKHLAAKDGLPETYSLDVTEDHYGFIWIATASGLVRYDGSKSIPLKQIVEDAEFLQSQYITTLLASGDSLWIGTAQGLSILNLSSGQITNHIFDTDHLVIRDEGEVLEDRLMIRDIYEDRQRNIWLAPSYSGFIKWDRNTGAFKRYPLFADPAIPEVYQQIDQTTLIAIIQDTRYDSVMWAGSMAGLVKLNTVSGQVSRILYASEDQEQQFVIDRKICIFQHESGIIYSGSWGGGLSIYDPVTGKYTHPDLVMLDNSTFFKNDHLFNITGWTSDHLYLSYGQGLYLYDVPKNTLRLLRRSIFKGDYEIRFGINFIDSKNRMWFPSNGGVTVSDPLVQQFNWYSLAELNPTRLEVLPRAIVEDFYPGYISMVGQYTDGIYHINPTTGHMFKHTFRPFKHPGDAFHAWGMNRLDDRRLLISEQNALYTFDRTSERFATFEAQLPLQYHVMTTSLVDHSGKLWQSSRNDGLFSMDLTTKNVTSYLEQTHAARTGRPFEDSRGNIWIFTGNGHLVFDRAQDKLLEFHYQADTTKTVMSGNTFCECPNGEIWAGAYKDGLVAFDRDHPEKGMIKRFNPVNKKNGQKMPVFALACNRKNELWGIGGGLARIDRDDWSCEVFDLAYGVKKWSGMFQFLKNDKLFISSRDGFYLVDPKELVINSTLPRPYVVSVVSNKGTKNHLEDHLKQQPVTLSAGENVVTIEFSAVNHTLAELTTYRYQLEGIDEDWIDPEDKRSLTYSYLPGGDYTFRLKAANNEGTWNEFVYELPISVGTPWYKTMVFWGILGMLILGLAYSIYQFRIQQIHEANQMKSTFEKKVAGLEMNALMAQMNPHFIFNCLNSIESYIIRNDTHKASLYLNNFGRLVRLILQNSRSSYISLEDELESIRLYLELEQMRFKRTFTYEIVIPKGLNPEVYEIPPMLIQPFLENAIWHGLNHRDQGGKLSLNIRMCGESLCCIIEDNGIGRVAAARIRAAQKVKRKSMGMDITMERIETINKIYNTNNEVLIEDLYHTDGSAAGTRVTLIIPL